MQLTVMVWREWLVCSQVPDCRDGRICGMNGCTFLRDTGLFDFESLDAQVFLQEVGDTQILIEIESLRLA